MLYYLGNIDVLVLLFGSFRNLEKKMNKLEQFDKVFVLVSGGIDSTYLFWKFWNSKSLKKKVYAVNCYNPYETSKTLNKIKKIAKEKFIEIKPDERYNYGKILRNSFLKLPEARILKKKHGYHKHIFECCYYIKHKAFLDNPLFIQPNAIIISGIKSGDGQRRRAFCNQLRHGSKYISQSTIPNNYYFLTEGKERPTFFHKHKQGQVYAYPFRDYFKRELPEICVRRLRKIFPELTHSACVICPVVVLFNVKKSSNYKKSVQYADKLGVLPYRILDNFIDIKKSKIKTTA